MRNTELELKETEPLVCCPPTMKDELTVERSSGDVLVAGVIAQTLAGMLRASAEKNPASWRSREEQRFRADGEW